MRFEVDQSARVFLSVFVVGLFSPVFAQTPDVPPPKTSEPSTRFVSRLDSTRFDVGGPVASIAWSPDTDGIIVIELETEFTGGTGRFSNVTGGFSGIGELNLNGGYFEGVGEGTISPPGKGKKR